LAGGPVAPKGGRHQAGKDARQINQAALGRTLQYAKRPGHGQRSGPRSASAIDLIDE